MTPATDKPTKRLVITERGEKLVAEITDRTLLLRPIRGKSPNAIVELTWGLIYQHGIMARIAERTRR